MRKGQQPANYTIQDAVRLHAEASIARLDERVDSLNADLSGIRSDMGEIRKAISGLTQAFSDRGRTQWQPLLTAGALVIAIVSTGGSVVGALALSPINDAIAENRAFVRTLPDDFVPRAEINQRWTFSDERAAWLDGRVDKLEDQSSFGVRDALDALNKRIDRLANEIGVGVPGRP